jgi:hypothetical protein
VVPGSDPNFTRCSATDKLVEEYMSTEFENLLI